MENPNLLIEPHLEKWKARLNFGGRLKSKGEGGGSLYSMKTDRCLNIPLGFLCLWESHRRIWDLDFRPRLLETR